MFLFKTWTLCNLHFCHTELEILNALIVLELRVYVYMCVCERYSEELRKDAVFTQSKQQGAVTRHVHHVSLEYELKITFGFFLSFASVKLYETVSEMGILRCDIYVTNSVALIYFVTLLQCVYFCNSLM